VWFSGAERGDVLLITAHHLAVDVVSWHIMLGDIAEAWRSVQSGAAPKTLPEFTSYRRWSELMWERAATPEVVAQREYWITQVREPDPALGRRQADPARDTWSTLRVTPAITPASDTARVLDAAATNTATGAGMREFLLAATTIAVASWRKERAQDPTSGALIALEGHGRADAVLDTDTTNTVGWFTTAFPVRLGVGAAAADIERAEADPAAARSLIDSVTAHLGTIPNEGLDYGLLRYVGRVPELDRAAEPQIQFGYLGRLDLSGATEQPWSLLTGPFIDALPIDPEPELPLRFAINLSVLVGATPEGPQLIANWRWSDALFAPADIDRLTHFWQRAIAALAAGLTRA
jgi:mycobactin peptide synthetase MbtF